MAVSVPACNLFDGRGSPVPRGAVQSPQLGHCREQQRDPKKLVELHCSVRRSGKIQVRARYKSVLKVIKYSTPTEDNQFSPNKGTFTFLDPFSYHHATQKFESNFALVCDPPRRSLSRSRSNDVDRAKPSRARKRAGQTFKSSLDRKFCPQVEPLPPIQL